MDLSGSNADILRKLKEKKDKASALIEKEANDALKREQRAEALRQQIDDSKRMLAENANSD